MRPLFLAMAFLVACGSSSPSAKDASIQDADGSAADASMNVRPSSDEFDGTSLDPKWRVFRGDVANVRVAGGGLSLEMTQGALWFQAGTSVMVYQEVSGDFAVEGPVLARKTSASSQPPASAIQLGGIIARNPSGGSENYVFIVVGFDEVDLSVETKSTTNSQSDYVGPAWPSGDAELRLCRRSSEFRLYKRPIGGATWELAMTYSRPDLPATLQVGAIAYAQAPPDLTVRIEALRFGDLCN